jgi:hypothetical protein
VTEAYVDQHQAAAPAAPAAEQPVDDASAQREAMRAFGMAAG